MKKIFIVLLGLLLIGCAKGEKVTCTVNNKKAVFSLKNGIITSYTLDGKKQRHSEIDELNGTYFTSSTTNEEGKLALQNYVNSLGGTCD